jgi:hypothetical protein
MRLNYFYVLSFELQDVPEAEPAARSSSVTAAIMVEERCILGAGLSRLYAGAMQWRLDG